jgi:hypothetical protein
VGNQLYQSLIQYIKDAELEVTAHFILFAFWLDQHANLPVVKNEKAVEEALNLMGFSKDCYDVMIIHLNKFLWPQLLRYLLTQTEDDRCVMVKII